MKEAEIIIDTDEGLDFYIDYYREWYDLPFGEFIYKLKYDKYFEESIERANTIIFNDAVDRGYDSYTVLSFVNELAFDSEFLRLDTKTIENRRHLETKFLEFTKEVIVYEIPQDYQLVSNGYFLTLCFRIINEFDDESAVKLLDKEYCKDLHDHISEMPESVKNLATAANAYTRNESLKGGLYGLSFIAVLGIVFYIFRDSSPYYAITSVLSNRLYWLAVILLSWSMFSISTASDFRGASMLSKNIIMYSGFGGLIWGIVRAITLSVAFSWWWLLGIAVGWFFVHGFMATIIKDRMTSVIISMVGVIALPFIWWFGGRF